MNEFTLHAKSLQLELDGDRRNLLQLDLAHKNHKEKIAKVASF